MNDATTRRTFLGASLAGFGLAAAAPAASGAPAEADSEARKARLAMRRGEWRTGTTHKCPGYVQCSMVVVRRDWAYDLLLFCQRNPRACPIIEITDPGQYEPKVSAPGADLRTDLPKFAIYRNGVRGEDVTDIKDLWTEDSVAFLIGSSLTFDYALERAGVPLSKEVWVLDSKLPTMPAGRFHSPLVVTMRWMTPAQAIVATQVTSRFPFNHGAPLHLGDPAEIGADLEHPIYGEPVKEIPKGVMPVFWACGVTTQRAALLAKPELMITHAPGHAFISDLKGDQVCTP